MAYAFQIRMGTARFGRVKSETESAKIQTAVMSLHDFLAPM